MLRVVKHNKVADQTWDTLLLEARGNEQVARTLAECLHQDMSREQIAMELALKLIRASRVKR